MTNTSTTKIRIVTAGALFDGHDAAINIMRRILQSKGAEIIHLGHNRSVAEIVECAIEEDVQGIAITSYQGGHVEFFKYMKDLLDKNGSGHIKIFGGGGGTILPSEIRELHDYGITRIYSPDDGRAMGLVGMIEDVLKQATQTAQPAAKTSNGSFALGESHDIISIARAITLAEEGQDFQQWLPKTNGAAPKAVPVLGITGTGGAGKSSVTDELVRRFLTNYPNKTIGVVSVDPSKKKTGGALLGDRIRMNAIHHPRAYMRSLATRESDKALSQHVQQAIDIVKAAGYDLVILESAGVGQSDASILDHCDVSLYVMTPEYGAASQLEKINMLDYADVVCINKFDKAGALDALSDVRKQYKRNHGLWTTNDDELPVIGTTAAKFNDEGIHGLFFKLMERIEAKTGARFSAETITIPRAEHSVKGLIIPPKRVRYLSEITDEIRKYNLHARQQAAIASKLYQLDGALAILSSSGNNDAAVESLQQAKQQLQSSLSNESNALLQNWQSLQSLYQQEFFEYDVRGKIVRQPLFSKKPQPKLHS